jgi:hypothetical protein
MESIVIKAVTLESAQGFCSALAAFEARLVEGEDGRYQVEVPLRGSKREILSALGTLEEYVSKRGDPAHLRLGEHQYTLHPADPPSAPPA